MARGRVKFRLAAAALAMAAGAGFLLWQFAAPYQGFHQQAIVEVPRGSTSRQIARILKGAGVIRFEWHLALARLFRPNAQLQAGEYRFDEPATPIRIHDRIARGDTFHFEVVVPEGSNMYDIAANLDKSGIITGKAFLIAASNVELIRDLAPKAPSLEGYLFPATYRLGRHTTAAQLVRSMTDRFRRTWKSLNAGGDPHRAVTLASLIEKETGVREERPVVASVFANRLAKSMKLDCDPTTIYAAILEGRYRGVIYRSDLDNPHPYNTYRRTGLPPGPIANPGQESLRAALYPASTEYLYFVAKADHSGGHVFSTNEAGHLKAVAEYRRANQKAKPTASTRANSRSRKSRSD